MWVRKRIDIGWRDILSIVARCCFPTTDGADEIGFDDYWADARSVLPVFSVRSGFDLFLQTANLPEGSEVLMSAYTIPDMPRIVEHHELVPIPVDLSSKDLGIDVEMLQKSITPKTRVLVVAHLFGIQLDLDKAISVAKKHGLLVIEDCAQLFTGKQFSGHAAADLTMFSFGPIKTATALAGGLLLVRDEKLVERMKSHQDSYPTQSRLGYLKKSIEYSLIKLISCRPFFGPLIGFLRFFKVDYDRKLNRLSRGFLGANFFEKLRKKPNAALAQTMLRRIRKFDDVLLRRRIERGDRLSQMLDKTVRSPGAISGQHFYWVFPVLVRNPRRLISDLRENGFDATQGESMTVIASPPGHPQSEPEFAHQLHKQLVYLPFYPELPDSALEKIPEILKRSGSAE